MKIIGVSTYSLYLTLVLTSNESVIPASLIKSAFLTLYLNLLVLTLNESRIPPASSMKSAFFIFSVYEDKNFLFTYRCKFTFCPRVFSVKYCKGVTSRLLYLFAEACLSRHRYPSDNRSSSAIFFGISQLKIFQHKTAIPFYDCRMLIFKGNFYFVQIYLHYILNIDFCFLFKLHYIYFFS